MTRGRVRPSAGDWISEYFGPCVSVLCSKETESVLGVNNLSATELLQPFSKLSSEVTLKDPEGTNHPVSGLALSFRDFRKDPHRSINSKLISDSVGFEEEGGMWFDVWKKLFLASLPKGEHEFLKSDIGVVLISSANEPDPIASLKSLESEVLDIHLRKKSSGDYYPSFAFDEPLRFYLVVGEKTPSQSLLSQIQSAFGASLSHFLLTNTRQSSEDINNDYWFNSLPPNRFCDIHTRRKCLESNTVATTSTCSFVVPQSTNPSNHTDIPDHPLAGAQEDEDIETNSRSSYKLVPASVQNVGHHLGSADIESIKKFVREFSIHGLVPYLEKQMRVLHEVVTNRKSRSLFSGAKRWFGQGKPGASSGTSVVYGKEAPELQVRKLGDLYFMIKLYKQAYNCYHNIKKDFQSDEAWNYYAGAAEMTALATFMQFATNSDQNGKKYPFHYMEDAISKYQQVCQMPDFALRATLFDTMCLTHLGMHQESANSYIRMTTDAKDLISSLLLEQAAYCYSRCKPPLNRKYAFHIILSAYKFSKSGQKEHSFRANKKGYEVYKGHDWSLSEDHILYNLGHLSLLLKDHTTAASLFNELFTTTTPIVNPLQQMCHLREFFIVQHVREKEDKKVYDIPIPKFIPQEIVIDLNNDRTTRYESLIHSNVKNEWQELEKVILENVAEIETPIFNKSCQMTYGPKSANNLIPQGITDESIRYLIPLSNDFHTPFLLKQVHLLWKFLPDGRKESEILDNGDPSAGTFVQTDVVDIFNLDKSSKMVLPLTLKPLKPGRLSITGVEYSLKALFSQSESTDYTIRGKQSFEIIGPRYTSIKDLKSGTHGPDYRLELAVRSSQPKLQVKFLTEVPEFLFNGEIRVLELECSNLGQVPLTNCSIISHSPGLFSFGGKRNKKLFEHPIINDPNLSKLLENGQITEKRLDVLPVPLDNKTLDPGKSIKLRIFMKSPQSLGVHSLKTHFYYENAVDKRYPRHRISSHQFNVKVIPSLEVHAFFNNSVVYDNSQNQSLSLKFVNVSGNNKTLESISVTQLGLISKNMSLNAILSAKKDDINVKRKESVKFCLSANNEPDREGNDEGFHFSALKSKTLKGSYSFHSPPYLDFVKSGFDFLPKEKPTLRNDLLASVWRSGDLNGIILSEIKPPSEYAQEEEERPEVEEESVSFVDGENVKTNHPVRVEIKSESIFEVNFERLRLFKVPFKVVISNLSNKNLYLHYRCVGEKKILGCTNGTDVLLETSSSRTLNFKAAITAPGLYHFRGGFTFQVSDAPGSVSDTSDMDLVPIDITFIVKNKSSVIV